MSNLPKTYKAAQIPAPGQPLTVVDKELKAPGRGEVLVKVQASSICLSDHIATTDKSGFPVPFPNTPGHEVIGKIAATGDDVDTKLWPVGKQVGLGWNGGYCGQCEHCRRGHFHWCTESRIHGVTQEGGHQQYVVTRVNALVSIPEGIKLSPAEMAPLLCGGITVLDALKAVQDVAKPGDLVAVIGIGGLGHLAIQYAVGMGYKVAAVSSSTAKAELAKKSGAAMHLTADKAAGELQKLGGAKAIIATAPSADAVNSALGGLGHGGKIVIVGLPSDGAPFQVPSIPLIVMRQSVCGLTCGSASDNEDTLRFSDLIGIKPHITTWSLDNARQGFEQTMSGKAEGRNVIVFE